MAARILVVDDNRSNRELMLYLLGAFGYEAEGAQDGLSGLEAAQSGAFDLVLLDMLMPGIDGYEFARRFKADPSLASIPLIAVTALAMVGDRKRILEAQIEGYISKPIDPQSFVDSIELHLSEEQRANVRRPGAVTKEPAPAVVFDGPLILSVDDTPANLQFLRAALTPFGYRVVDAGSVEEAILLLGRARPALIVCDVHMPGRSGFELLEYVNKEAARLGNVRFVFISSGGWDADRRRRAVSSGVATFVERPIDPERLRREIEQVLTAP